MKTLLGSFYDTPLSCLEGSKNTTLNKFKKSFIFRKVPLFILYYYLRHTQYSACITLSLSYFYVMSLKLLVQTGLECRLSDKAYLVQS